MKCKTGSHNCKIFFSSILLLIFFCENVNAQTEIDVSLSSWKPGKVIFSPHQWVEVIPGDIPLVISVPHGGAMRPESIPDRNCKVEIQGTFVNGIDGRTIQTARAIEAAFVKRYHKRPFIIISNIGRHKVDQNRDIELGACGNKLAEEAWYDFHNSIDTALALAVKKFGYAIYIDLHGHGHKNSRLELGYSFTGRQLKEIYHHQGNLEKYGERSSLQNYFKMNKKADLRNLIWGKRAFGTLIVKEGFAASPSMQDRYPAEGERFFSGGYNTRRYTSSNYPNVLGWQIEANNRGVRDNKESRDLFATGFVRAYTRFVKKYLH